MDTYLLPEVLIAQLIHLAIARRHGEEASGTRRNWAGACAQFNFRCHLVSWIVDVHTQQRVLHSFASERVYKLRYAVVDRSPILGQEIVVVVVLDDQLRHIAQRDSDGVPAQQRSLSTSLPILSVFLSG